MSLNEQATCAKGVMSASERADFHSLLDAILDAPDSKGVVVLAASVRDGGAMIGCLVHGYVAPQDVVIVCGKGGAQLLKQMGADEGLPASEVRQ